MKKAPSIYNYRDYRKFIIAFIKHKELELGTYPWNDMALELGFKSNSYIIEVCVSRIKSLSIDSAFKFANVLGLWNQEVHFFYLMVLHNNSTDKEERQFLRFKMSEIKESN